MTVWFLMFQGLIMISMECGLVERRMRRGWSSSLTTPTAPLTTHREGALQQPRLPEAGGEGEGQHLGHLGGVPAHELLHLPGDDVGRVVLVSAQHLNLAGFFLLPHHSNGKAWMV